MRTITAIENKSKSRISTAVGKASQAQTPTLTALEPEEDSSDEFDEDLSEEASENGECVFSYSWTSDHAGGSYLCTVNKYKGRYYHWSDSDKPAGGFETLEEALPSISILAYATVTTTELTPQEMFKLLGVVGDAGQWVDVNDEFWYRISGGEMLTWKMIDDRLKRLKQLEKALPKASPRPKKGRHSTRATGKVSGRHAKRGT